MRVDVSFTSFLCAKEKKRILLLLFEKKATDIDSPVDIVQRAPKALRTPLLSPTSVVRHSEVSSDA